MNYDYILTLILAFMPISELRGAIPYALANGISLPITLIMCYSANVLVGPLAFLFMNTFHKWFQKNKLYKSFMDKTIERTRLKIHDKVEKYGYWGLTLFVAVPLPVTGAWTGALGAWIFGMNMKKSLLSIAIGVAIAAVIVTTVSLLGIEALSFLTKQVHI